jgi:hypothetical protein
MSTEAIVMRGEQNLLDSIDMVATGKFLIRQDDCVIYHLATGGRKYCPLTVTCRVDAARDPLGRTHAQAIVAHLDNIRLKAKNAQGEQNTHYQALVYLIDNLFEKHYVVRDVDVRVAGFLTTYHISMCLNLDLTGDESKCSALEIEFVSHGGDFLKVVPTAVAREMSYYTANYETDGRISEYSGYAMIEGVPTLIVKAELFPTAEDMPHSLASESSLACYAFNMKNLYKVEFAAHEVTSCAFYYMRDQEHQAFRGDVVLFNTMVDRAYASRISKGNPDAV